MTDTTIQSWGSIELAVKALLLAKYQPLVDLGADAGARVGGDLDFDADTQDFYIRLDKVPGGNSDRFGGTFVIDVEVFGSNYLETESRSLDIESLLLGYPHVVEAGSKTWVFDSVSQNVGPDDLPWEDDSVARLGATYVITARRR